MNEKLKQDLLAIWRPASYWFTIILLMFSLTINHTQWQVRTNLIAERDSLSWVITHKDTAHGLVSEHNSNLAEALHVFTDGHPVVFTGYNALEWQTDDSPRITASNDSVYEGGLALSRDFLNIYGLGGEYEWGDTVWVVLPMEVNDSMNKRWTGKADIYMENLVDALRFGRKEGYIYSKGG